MTLFVFLNELSQPQGSIPPEPAGEVAARFVRLLRRVRRERRDSVLHTVVPLHDVRIGDDYSFAMWRNDGDRRDEWRFLRSLEDRAPFRVRLAELGIDAMETDYRHGETRAEGLGLAHMFGGLAVSFDHDLSWHEERVRLLREALVETDDGDIDIDTSDVETMHASHREHVGAHADWLEHACRQAAVDGGDLWRRREELLPHLAFLPRVEAQLAALKSSQPWFAAVSARLEELNTALSEWDPARAPEPAWRSRVTPEHVQRRQLCRFEDLDGETRIFDLHARFTPGAGRLHFRLDADRRRAIVAHVGRKLGE